MMEKYLPNFRKAYPAYNDLSDDQLIIALRKKYPMYDDMDNSMFIGAIERRFSQKSSEDSPSMPSPLGINMLRPFGIDAMMAAVPQIIEHAPSLGRGAAKEVESTPQVAGRILQEAGETAELVPDNKFPDINMLNLLKEAVFQGNPLSAAIQAKEGKIPYSESLKIYNWGKNLTQDILMPGTRKMRAEVFKATDIDENVAEFGRKLAEDNQRYIENKYKPEETPLKQFLSDLGSGSVSLATALGVSLLTKSPNAAAIMFGVMGKARAYGEAREAGKDPLEASDISTMVGLGEGVLEYIGLDFMLKRFATPIKGFVIRTASEAMQEGLQTISERGIMTAAGVQEFKGLKPILKEAAYSALMGAILGGGASTIMSTIESRLNEKGVDSETSRKIAESIVQKASDRAVTLSEKIKNAKGKLINESDLQNISDQMSKGLITREELREKALKELSEASGLMKEIDEMTVKHVEVKEAQKEKFDQLVKEGKKQVKKAGLNKVKYATLTRRFGGLKIEGDLAGEVKLLPLYTKNKNGFTINEMAQKFIEAGYPVKSTRDLLDKLRNKEEFTLEEKGAEEAMEAEELEGREAEITAFEKYKPEDMPAGMIADKGVGTKFKIEGEEFEVKKNEPGDIIIEDGKRFEVDEFDKIPVDHGKLIAAKKGKEESDTSVLPKDVAQASKDKGLRYDGEASGIHYWTVPVTESGLVLKPSEMTGDILKVKLDKHYREWYKEKRELYMSGQIKEGTQEYEMLLKLGEILGQEELTKEKAPPEQIIKQTWEMTKAEFREYEDQRTKGAAENTRKAALHGPNLYFNQKLAIERALKEGREVPENVLAEWPRLSELAKESVVSDDVVNDYLKNKDIKQDEGKVEKKKLRKDIKSVKLEEMKPSKGTGKTSTEKKSLKPESGGVVDKLKLKVQEYNKILNNLKFVGKITNKKKKLSDIISSDKLFKEVPRLKNTYICIKQIENTDAVISNDFSNIYISPKLTPEQQINTIKHELVHALQEREGLLPTSYWGGKGVEGMIDYFNDYSELIAKSVETGEEIPEIFNEVFRLREKEKSGNISVEPIKVTKIDKIKQSKIIPDDGSEGSVDWHTKRLFGGLKPNDPKPIKKEYDALRLDLGKGNGVIAEDYLQEIGFENVISSAPYTVDIELNEKNFKKLIELIPPNKLLKLAESNKIRPAISAGQSDISTSPATISTKAKPLETVKQPGAKHEQIVSSELLGQAKMPTVKIKPKRQVKKIEGREGIGLFKTEEGEQKKLFDAVNDYLKNKDIKQDDLLIASKQLNFELDKIEEVIDDEYKIGAEERIITGKGTKKDVEVTFNEKDLVSVLIPNIIKNPPDVAHFKGKIIKSAKDFANLLLPIRSVYFESLKVAYLDKNNRILDAQVVSVGNLGSSIVDPAEIVSLAPEGTKGVLVAHNHPSGSTTPSNEDIKINQVLRKAIFTGGYKYIDHVITDGDEFYSFQAEVSEKVGKYYQLAEEKFRSSIGMKLTSPDDFNKLTDLLRQGNNENNHIIFLNAQNKIMAIQRLKGEMEDISRSAIKNMRKYGSLGVLIDYPMGNVNDIQKLSFLLKDTNVNLLDVSSLENYSFAAQGLLREEVSKYGAKGKITKKEKIKSKVRKGIRPILKLVEPAKLAEWKHGAEVVARVIKAFHHSQAETIEFAERKSDVSDKTFGEVERYLRDHFSNEDLDRFMLTRGFPNTVEGVILQKEATQSISPEMRKLSKRILDVTQNAADLAYNKLLRYVEEISKSEGMTVEQMTEMNFLYVDEYFRGQYKNTEYYKNFQREIKKKIEQYIRNTKSFMKPKLFPTYADSKGVYGVELKNPNPITNIKSEIAAIERLRANHWLRDSLMDSGRDKYIMRETLKHIHPPKWKEIGPEGDIVWKDIWAEPELARLINNLLKLNLITSSKSGRFFWKMNNYLRAIKFLGSTFHQGSVTKQAFADNGWFGFMNPKRFMGTIGTALKISRKAHQKVLNDPVTKKAYRKYIQLGGTPIGHEGSFEYELAAIKQFEKLFDKLGILKATKTKAGKILLAGPKFPFSYVNWLFRWYIPQLKFQAYLKDIVRREKKLGKNLTDAELIETVKEGQNFYGEMNERLFGRSGTVTTLMRFIWMAPGYAEGNYRTNLKALFQWKKGGPGSRSRNNIVNSLLISSILATIGTLIFRGKGPDKPEKLEDVRDYFKIDTGMLDDKGEKIMIDLLTYDKDYWEIYGRLLFGEREKIPTSVIDRLGGMNSTLLEVATDIGLLMQGKALIDWKGDEIVHVTDPAMTKLLKYAMYEIDKVTPISLSVAQQARRRGVNDIVSYLQAVIGLRPTYTEQARRVKEQRRVISSYRDEREEIFRYLTTKRDPRKQIENYNKRIQVFIDNKFLSDEIRNTGKKLLIDLDMYIYRSVKRLRSTSTSSYDKQKIRKRLANLGIMPTDYARILMRKPYRRKKLKRIVK